MPAAAVSSCCVVLLLLLLLCFSSSAAQPAPMSVRIRVNVTGHVIRLTCDVTGAPDAESHEVQFFCPLGTKCFGDCNPICSMQGDSSCRVVHSELLSPGVNCSRSVRPPSAKTVQLVIDTRQAALAGVWFCKFRGRASAEVTLNQFKPPPPPPTTAAPDAASTAAATTALVAVATIGTERPGTPGASEMRIRSFDATTAAPAGPGNRPRQQEELDVWKPPPGAVGPVQQPKGQEADPSLLQFARADYVIGILTLLGVSLIINVAFCIRCFLANYYVAVRRRKQEPPGCLAQCLCVSTVQVEEPAHQDETYEELRGIGRSGAGSFGTSQRGRQRTSLGTMETTYMEHSGCIPRSRTLPPASNPQYGLSYLQGVSDSMSRLMYDSVPVFESRPGSRAGSVRGFSGGGGVGGAGGLGGSLRRSQQLGVPVVPEESVPFIGPGPLAEATPADEADDASSSGSGAARLELSRRMLRKADTLLREANSLLRESAQQPAQQPPMPRQQMQQQQMLQLQQQQQQQEQEQQQQQQQQPKPEQATDQDQEEQQQQKSSPIESVGPSGTTIHE